jgi:hypothetical protein
MDTRTPSELAMHNAFWQIHHQNIQTVANAQVPRPIAAGIGATALGAHQMLQAGVQPTILHIQVLPPQFFNP